MLKMMIAALAFCFSLHAQSACAAVSNKSVLDDKLIVIATGGVSGVYYPVGGALCRVINKERNTLGIRCNAESTPGSIYNLIGLKKLDFDFAIVQSDWEEHAYNGTGAFLQQGGFEKLRRVMPLHYEAFTVIVRHDSEIESLDALKDKKINLGPLGSGGRATMHDIMRAKGWSDIDFKSLSAIPNDAQVPSLCGGQIDAIVMATGHPNALIADISKTCAVRMLSINDPIVDKFISGNPEIGYTIIKGGMYTGIPNDVKTFGTRAILVTTSDASDEMVYNIVKAVNANFTAFKSLHPVLAELSDKSMGENPQIAPYHPGAARYFAEHAAK